MSNLVDDTVVPTYYGWQLFIAVIYVIVGVIFLLVSRCYWRESDVFRTTLTNGHCNGRSVDVEINCT